MSAWSTGSSTGAITVVSGVGCRGCIFRAAGTQRYRFEPKESGEYSIRRDRQDGRADRIVVGQAKQAINSYQAYGETELSMEGRETEKGDT